MLGGTNQEEAQDSQRPQDIGHDHDGSPVVPVGQHPSQRTEYELGDKTSDEEIGDGDAGIGEVGYQLGRGNKVEPIAQQ